MSDPRFELVILDDMLQTKPVSRKKVERWLRSALLRITKAMAPMYVWEAWQRNEWNKMKERWGAVPRKLRRASPRRIKAAWRAAVNLSFYTKEVSLPAAAVEVPKP